MENRTKRKRRVAQDNILAKAFSPDEKQTIRTALMDAGIKRFATQGIRAARIDDICRDVGIAKGSFYTFFPSKEDLFMTLANERDAAHKVDMLAFLQTAQGEPREIVLGFFDFLMERIESDPVLKIVTDAGEINHLIRKVSPVLMAENNQRDTAFLSEIADIFQQRHGLVHADLVTLEGLMTIMVSLGLQAELIDSSTGYEATIALMRELFLARLMKGPYND